MKEKLLSKSTMLSSFVSSNILRILRILLLLNLLETLEWTIKSVLPRVTFRSASWVNWYLYWCCLLSKTLGVAWVSLRTASGWENWNLDGIRICLFQSFRSTTTENICHIKILSFWRCSLWRTWYTVLTLQLGTQSELVFVSILIHFPNGCNFFTEIRICFSFKKLSVNVFLPRITFWSTACHRNNDRCSLCFGYTLRVTRIAFWSARWNGNDKWCCLLYLLAVRWAGTVFRTRSWWWNNEWSGRRLLFGKHECDSLQISLWLYYRRADVPDWFVIETQSLMRTMMILLLHSQRCLRQSCQHQSWWKTVC